MLVVDVNTIAYLYLPSPFTTQVEQLLEYDFLWVAPQLWRSEMCSVLAKYLRQSIISERSALEILQAAEQQLLGHEYQMNLREVLQLSLSSGCSSYDCEYLVLAKNLGVPLISADKKLKRIFPDIVFTAEDYLASR